MAGTCCELPILDGMTPEQLQALYNAIVKAIFDLRMGRREVTVSYAQGDGAKSVTYNQGATDVTWLEYMLRYVGAALGKPCGTRRRAIAVVFP